MNAVVTKFNINSLVSSKEVSKKDCQKALVILTKGAESRDKIIHAVAWNALRHTAEDGNGDASLLDAVIPALGKSGRPEMFKNWVSSFSPYYFDKELNRFKKAKKGKQNIPFNLDEAWAKPFFSVEERKVNDPNAFIDFADITELAIKQLGVLVKRIDNSKIDSKGHSDLVNELKTKLIQLKDQVQVVDRNYKTVTNPDRKNDDKEPVAA